MRPLWICPGFHAVRLTGLETLMGSSVVESVLPKVYESPHSVQSPLLCKVKSGDSSGEQIPVRDSSQNKLVLKNYGAKGQNATEIDTRRGGFVARKLACRS